MLLETLACFYMSLWLFIFFSVAITRVYDLYAMEKIFIKVLFAVTAFGLFVFLGITTVELIKAI